jgi:hypothetical protein
VEGYPYWKLLEGWAERLPETRRVVITTKLELGASVAFIHKEFIMMHGHTVLKIPPGNYSAHRSLAARFSSHS